MGINTDPNRRQTICFAKKKVSVKRIWMRLEVYTGTGILREVTKKVFTFNAGESKCSDKMFAGKKEKDRCVMHLEHPEVVFVNLYSAS